MFISSLNRFFEKHSRKTFTIITAVIIVSFVLYFSPGYDILIFFEQKKHPYAIPEAEITREEFQKALTSSIILTSIQFGASPLNDQFIHQFAYYQAPELAVIAKIANKRGFSADDKAVFEKITGFNAFKKDGKFDKDLFENYVKNTLKSANLSSNELEDAVRKDIAKSRLKTAVLNSTIASTQETEFDYQFYNQLYKVKLFEFKKSKFKEKVKYSDEDLQAYFNANQNNYKIPPQFKLLIARFKYSDFVEQARKEITQEMIENYYNSNKQKFTKDNTTLPLDSVKNEIIETLANDQAKQLALNAAQSFSTIVYEKSFNIKEKKVSEIFNEEATKQNIKLFESDWLDANTQIIKNIGKEPEIAMQSADLTVDQPLSDAIQGQNAAYVSLLIERKEECPATFNEVKDKVLNDFLDSKSANLANQAASELALKLNNQLSEGKKINELIINDTEADITDLEPFSLSNPPNSPHSSILTELVLKTKIGSISEVRNTPDSTIFILPLEKNEAPKDDQQKITKHKTRYLRNKEDTTWLNFLHSSTIKKTNKNK